MQDDKEVKHLQSLIKEYPNQAKHWRGILQEYLDKKKRKVS